MSFFQPNRAVLLIALLALGCSKKQTGEEVKLTSWVDPFIGTGGHGHTFPGPTLPFGMVQLGPDTRLEGWDGCSGYHYTDNVIYGFSHTHLSGTGIADYCDILFMPTVGDVKLTNGYPDDPDTGYASRFSKSSEKAGPGFYEVHLDDYNIDVALTTTKRAGFHSYTFPPGAAANVIVDLEHRDPVLDSRLVVTGPEEISGFRISSSWAKEQHVYFVAQFSRPFVTHGIALHDSIVTGADDVNGKSVKGFFRFADTGEPLLVKVGISAVDIDGARKNLIAEIPGWNFSAVRDSADATWEAALSKIVVETSNSDNAAHNDAVGAQKTTFYTALYHTMIAPNLFSDVDGRFRGTDLRVHPDGGGDLYTVFSLWDTFRAVHPLYTIIERARASDFIRTFIAQYEIGGRLPVWELAGNYTNTMIGQHSIPIIIDAYAKGIRGFDTDIAVRAMLAARNEKNRGRQAIDYKGYISANDEAESVSKTLEYAYDDWCLLTTIAGSPEMSRAASALTRSAQAYKNLYDPSTGFLRAKVDGVWFSPFDPTEVNFNYTEANAWQYRFFVPHDIAGLMDLMGGSSEFEKQLDMLFESPSKLTGRSQPDITGLVGQYAHGNEPSHHVTYLYNYAGVPWKTQARVRQIMDDMYAPTPDGLAGNEDCGQMSAWYVFSSLGFYPVTPGLSYYTIGTPLFESAAINLENGNTFTVRANGVSAENIYIQSATLNGEPYTHSFLEHDVIMNGGEIVFEMGPKPNMTWATQPDDIPVSQFDYPHITPTPYFVADSRTFTDELTVEVGVLCEDCHILLNIIHEDTDRRFSKQYREPLVVTETSTIIAVAGGRGHSASVGAVAKFIKIPDGRNITLGTDYAGQYAAGGDNALIDRQRGSDDFRTGSWQGYEGVDLDAIVDLGSVQPVGRVSAGFLQDIQSWIWLPKRVEFAVSTDGTNFQVISTVASDVADDEYGAITRELSVDVNAEARYVRVRAKNYGECPDWHPGAGGKAWIFVDEISIE